MFEASVVNDVNAVKSISEVRRRAKRHNLVMKRRPAGYALYQPRRMQLRYNGRRVEISRPAPVTDTLTPRQILQLCDQLDQVIEHVSSSALLKTLHPSLFEQLPVPATEMAVH